MYKCKSVNTSYPNDYVTIAMSENKQQAGLDPAKLKPKAYSEQAIIFGTVHFDSVK